MKSQGWPPQSLTRHRHCLYQGHLHTCLVPPSSVPGVRPRADIPGSLPFASQDFKSRREFWRPRVPSGNLGLGLACGLGWVTSPIMLTPAATAPPTALIPTLQPSHIPTPPTTPPIPISILQPLQPPVLIHPSLYTPHSLIFSAGAHSSSDSLTLPGPWVATKGGGSDKGPRASGSLAGLSQGPKLCRPSALPAPRDSTLGSLPFSTVHLSSVSSSLGLLPSFWGFSEGWKVGGSCWLSPRVQEAGIGLSLHWGLARGGDSLSTHSALPSLRSFPGQCRVSGAWEAEVIVHCGEESPDERA